jgi:hypothetical protein
MCGGGGTPPQPPEPPRPPVAPPPAPVAQYMASSSPSGSAVSATDRAALRKSRGKYSLIIPLSPNVSGGEGVNIPT